MKVDWKILEIYTNFAFGYPSRNCFQETGDLPSNWTSSSASCGLIEVGCEIWDLRILSLLLTCFLSLVTFASVHASGQGCMARINRSRELALGTME